MNRIGVLGLMAVATCAPILASGKSLPVFDLAASPGDQASSFLESSKLKDLAGTRKLAIANFRVEFAVSNTGKSSSSYQGITVTRSDITLTGISDDARKDIADQLYAKLTQELTAAGFEVVPYQTVAATKAYQTLASVLKDSQTPVSTQSGQSIFVGPRGMPVYMTNDDKHLSLGSVLGGFSTTQPQNIEPGIARELDAAVLRVTFAVDFAEFKTQGGAFASGSSVKGNYGLALLPEQTQILVVPPKGGRGRVNLATGIAMQSDALSVHETTTTGSKVAQGLGNALTMLAGAGAQQSLKKFEASADQAAYSNAIVDYGSAVEAAEVSLLKGAAGL